MHWAVRAVGILGMMATLVACAGSARPQVWLTDQVEVGVTRPVEARPAVGPTPIRIAIANVVSPRETFRSYQDLIAYIGKRVGRPPEFIQRTTYAEVNALVRSGQADLAFVCSLAYVEGQAEFGMELLASPMFRGQTEYYSYLIVPAESGATSLKDLRGGVFAFSDPLSNSGWLAPTYQVLQLGERSDTFFRRRFYTYSHDNSIRAVADGLVDGAAVDSIVYESTVDRIPGLKRRLRVIDRFGPFGNSPFVLNPALPEARKTELRQVLLTMDQDPEGQRILQDLEFDRFVGLPDSAFDGVRKMLDAIRTSGQAQR